MKEDIKDYVERYPTYLESLDQIDQLKQQLAETEQKFLEFQEDSIRNEQTYVRELTEKQNTIDEINKEFVQAVHDWKTLCAEKDKEIEKLKQQYTILENENGKLTTELIMGKYKKAQKEVSFGKQLAIQELEKVIDYIKEHRHTAQDNRYIVYVKSLKDQINKQIKELKGEKDDNC